jgi:hypothetical protein
MESQQYNFTIPQGATFNLNLQYELNSQPVDIEGYEVRMQIRKSYDLPAVVELTTENGGIVVSDVNNIDLTIDAETTEELTAGRYLYDIELVDDNVVERILLGVATVSAEVTK